MVSSSTEILNALRLHHEDDLARTVLDVCSQADQNLKAIDRRLTRQSRSKALGGLLRRLRRASRRICAVDSTTLTERLWQKALALFARQLSRVAVRVVLDQVCDTLDELRLDEVHWQSRLSRPIRHFIESSPISWVQGIRAQLLRDDSHLSVPPSQVLPAISSLLKQRHRGELEDKVTQIRQFSSELLVFLCSASRICRRLDSVDSFPDGAEPLNLSTSVRDLFALLSDSYQATELNQYTMSQFDSFKTLGMLDSSTVNCLDELPLWRSRLCDRRAPLQRPNHIRRYWLHYTVGFGASLALASKVQHHQVEIADKFRSVRLSVVEFFREQLWLPLRHVLGQVFSRDYGQQSLASLQDDLNAEQRALSTMLRSFAERHPQSVPSGDHSGDPLQTMHAVQEAADRGDMSLVMDNYTNEVQTPKWNIAFGSLLENFMIQVQKLKVDGLGTQADVTRVMDANEINFQLLATLPALALSWSTLSLVRSVIVRTPVHRQIRTRLRQALHDLQHAHIDAQVQSTPSQPSQPQSPHAQTTNDQISMAEQHGHLVWRLHRFRCAVEQCRLAGLIDSLGLELLRDDISRVSGLDVENHQISEAQRLVFDRWQLAYGWQMK